MFLHRTRRLSVVVSAISLGAILATGVAVAQTRTTAPANKFGRSQPVDRTKNSIRIATYNTLNLFDHVDDPALSGEWDDKDLGTSDDRCRAMAAAIRLLDADILALQEVESLDALTWFRDTYLTDMGYKHLVSLDGGYMRGVEQSVLSRFPISDTRVWLNADLNNIKRQGDGWSDIPRDQLGKLTFRRSPLFVNVKVNNNYELSLIVVHHKAGGLEEMYWRETEALGVVQIVNELQAKDPSRNILVLGDFNAAPWDKSVRVYLEAGMIDTLSHRIIPHWKSPSESTIREANLFKTHESDRVIDYILLNSAAHREFVTGSGFVLGTLKPPPDYNWRTDTPPPGYASDHYPVSIELIPRDRM